jgi:hypothetical protein
VHPGTQGGFGSLELAEQRLQLAFDGVEFVGTHFCSSDSG